MLECPHCNKPSISIMSKAHLGPARTIKCKECEGKVSVEWKYGFLFSTVVVFLLILNLLIDSASLGILLIGMLLGMYVILVYLEYVPLKKR